MILIILTMMAHTVAIANATQVMQKDAMKEAVQSHGEAALNERRQGGHANHLRIRGSSWIQSRGNALSATCLEKWQHQGFVRSTGKIKNNHLWQQLDALVLAREPHTWQFNL